MREDKQNLKLVQQLEGGRPDYLSPESIRILRIASSSLDANGYPINSDQTLRDWIQRLKARECECPIEKIKNTKNIKCSGDLFARRTDVCTEREK